MQMFRSNNPPVVGRGNMMVKGDQISSTQFTFTPFYFSRNSGLQLTQPLFGMSGLSDVWNEWSK